jgi:hypothetical protein
MINVPPAFDRQENYPTSIYRYIRSRAVENLRAVVPRSLGACVPDGCAVPHHPPRVTDCPWRMENFPTKNASSNKVYL